MELEFDKEMDAILRKARGGSGVPVTSSHLDADTIAAFVENALPEKAKLLNIAHFADCDRCRKQLAFAMSMNTEAEPVAAAAFTPVAEAAIPWYSKIFRTPNLALAMGALVVAFSGIIGYLAIQNRNTETRSDVAMTNKPLPAAAEPMPATAANSANSAPINPAAAGTPGNPGLPTTQASPGAPGTSSGRADQPVVPAKPEAGETYGAASDDKEKSAAAAVPVDPPAPATGGQPMKTEERKDDAKLKDEDVALADSTKTGTDRGALREGPASPKKVGPGATRDAGPRATQQQSNTNVYNEMQYRSVGGKNFDIRGGVWYDTSYNGQPMIRVTRGSDEYKKLDSSIRRAAESLGGTVVVVWNAKAYRIQ